MGRGFLLRFAGDDFFGLLLRSRLRRAQLLATTWDPTERTFEGGKGGQSYQSINQFEVGEDGQSYELINFYLLIATLRELQELVKVLYCVREDSPPSRESVLRTFIWGLFIGRLRPELYGIQFES